jgi:formylglycine-generating enzyme required for sulfatase activity
MSKKTLIITVLSSLLLSVLAQAAPQAEPQSPKDEVPGMSLVPAGEFWMGRMVSYYYDRIQWLFRPYMDDRPVHSTYVDAFYMDKYEVTNTDYARFTEATARGKPWHWGGGKITAGQENWPVYNVNWEDAQAYCSWAGKRLPTEAEWEKAARGGLDRKSYPWGDELTEAQKKDDSRYGEQSPAKKRAHYAFPNGPAPVGSYPATGYDLYDLVGNVWEWTADWYEREYYVLSPEKNPKGPDTGKYKVLRGGGWSTKGQNIPQKYDLLAVHSRNYADPTQSSNSFGFRCAKSAEEPQTSQP